ncbi:MAG: chitobiase/beta-hexosaminidase C-terminal domain-containing protein, partial [Luteolibacter sp.]
MKLFQLLIMALASLSPCHAEVIINELVATNSDKQLVRDSGQYPRVGNTLSWQQPTFDDSLWKIGTGPFGFGETGITHGTDVSGDVKHRTPSLYLRKKFSVSSTSATSTTTLQLSVRYNDGFIAFLNGVEIARRNMGSAGMFAFRDQTSFNAQPSNAITTIDLGQARNFLVTGENTLSIQVHNQSLTDTEGSTLLLAADLKLSTGTILSNGNDPWKYFGGIAEPSGGLIDYGQLANYTATTVPWTLELSQSENDDVDPSETESDAPDSENDWIELKNTSPSAVSLNGWSLSDSPEEPRKWTFPPGTSIPANGYLVVIASDLDLTPAQDATTYLHTNFKLSSGGERVVLNRPDGSVADQLSADYPLQNWRYSYGRQADGAFGYLATATPGAENTGAALTLAPALPAFSVEGGFHSNTQNVTLSCVTPSSTIRYSIDGSDPLNGTIYSSPINVSSNRIIRARSFLNGAIPSAPITHTYLIGQSAARKSLPAIILGGDPKLTYYGPNTSGAPSDGEGILSIKGGTYPGEKWNNNNDTSAFNFPSLHGRAGEKNATLEYLPLTGTSLRTELGIRIAGSNHARPRYKLTNSASSRFDPMDITQKPSFNIFFRSEFSDKPIEYPHFFPGSFVTKFENIRLRAGKNDITNPFLIDELMRRTFIATGQQGSVGTFNTLWINGVYKGYYNMTERLREAFMQQHHNSQERWDVQQVNIFSDGDPTHWNQMWTYLRSADLTTTSEYAGVLDFLDVDNFIDYLLVNAYAATGDWPNNNWVAARERSTNGRWRFYLWDAESSFGLITGRNTSFNSFTSDLFMSDAEANSTGSRYIPALYTLLKKSPEFRLRFADRAQKQLFNGGALVNANMTAIFNQLKAEINPIMGDTIGQSVNESFHNTWIVSTTRRQNLFSQMTEQGFWPATTAPSASQYGGEIASGYQLTLTNPNPGGTIYLSTDGSDPRAPGGTVTGSAYTGPVTLIQSTRVRARILSSGNWSPEIDLAFTVPYTRPHFIHSPTGTTSRDWTSDLNWTTSPAPYPNGTGAEASIPAAPSARNAELGAPVTIGSLIFDQQNSDFRSRVRDKGTGNTLTFSSPAGAEIIVTGNGTGYAEFEVEAGSILADDLTLDTQNIVGDPEHGALRLRADWSGPGGIIKTGPGIASMTGDGKTFTGPILISQGVLNLTQPSAPTHCPSVTVTPGGQLRLSSGTAVGEPDRIYTFGGTITLSGEGRGAEIADGEQYGKLGALRYEPGSGSNRAVLTNPIQLNAFTDIHVGGGENRLTLADSITGSYPFRKSGGGTLKLAGAQAAYSLPISVTNGTVEISGTLASPVELASTGILKGSGATAAITGPGHILLPQTLLSAPSSSAPSYSFVFGKTGLP